MSGGPSQDFDPGKFSGTVSELRKISVNPQPRSDLSGDSDDFSGFSGVSLSRKDNSMFREGRNLSRERCMHSEGVDESVGDALLAGAIRFSRKVAPETIPVLFKPELEPPVSRSRVPLQDLEGDKEGSSLVGRPSSLPGRSITAHAEPQPSVVCRRIGHRLGSDARFKGSVRHLGGGTGVLAHQQKGVDGGLASPKSLRVPRPGCSGSDQLGQHHSPGIHQEARGDALLLPVRNSMETSTVVEGKEDKTPHQIRAGRKERQGRPSEQEKPSPSLRVDSSLGRVPGAVEDVGQTSLGSIRDLQERKDRPLVLPDIRPDSSSDRCFSARLEASRPLCVPSLQDSGRNTKKVCSIGRGKNDIDSSVLARPRLVHRGTGMVSRHSKIPATKSRSAQTAPLRQVSQEPPRSQSDWTQTVKSLVRAKGFSAKTARAIATARRPSTIRVYQLKWDVFRRWCRNQKLSSSSTSVTQIADFLFFPREKCGLAVSTIKGYRSMLASVFRHRALNISEDKDLHDLIRSFETTKKVSNLTPSWNLDVVLLFLRSSRFEPPQSASFRDLTMKSLFLMALALAKRVSELQALEGSVGFKGDSVICSFLPSFLAKNENPSTPWPRSFEVKGLSSLVGVETERTLCPIRSLKFYLHRKKKLKGNMDNLWCSVRDPNRPLSKNALAFFIRNLIKEAHVACDQDHYKLLKVKAHEVKAIARLLAFKKKMSLQNLMKATLWRCNSVFANYYLRDVKITEDKILDGIRPLCSSGHQSGELGHLPGYARRTFPCANLRLQGNF
ncbi:uncharacterized protein LOC135211385 [Macrobrachium nipponense]|uniref:uncharacterized protein LOC135211385 n=1 Tax=Macrobrachium nipponense TaxID=159736 RepID=UPI0030C7B19F